LHPLESAAFVTAHTHNGHSSSFHMPFSRPDATVQTGSIK
jgi:hypothetical protein